MYVIIHSADSDCKGWFGLLISSSPPCSRLGPSIALIQSALRGIEETVEQATSLLSFRSSPGGGILEPRPPYL